MLNALHDEHRSRIARRPPRSLKQEYQEFLLQRIEEYKNRLSRAELLELVDRIIARRLRLPAFPRWRSKHRALRAAQREPTHWGLEPDGPLVSCAARLEPGDLALVLGAAALPAALYLAAHDAEVFLL